MDLLLNLCLFLSGILNIHGTFGTTLRSGRAEGIPHPDVSSIMLLKLDFHLSNIDQNIQDLNRFFQLYIKDLGNKISNIEGINKNIENKTEQQVHLTENVLKKVTQINKQLDHLNSTYDKGKQYWEQQLQVTKKLISSAASVPSTLQINYKSSPSIGCKVDKGERVLDASCMSYHNEEKSWLEAVKFCQSLSGQLYFPNINDDTLDQKLHRIFPQLDSKFVWIGGRYRENAFKTLDGEIIPMDHPRWVRGHPFSKPGMNSEDHNCLLLYFFRHHKHRLWLAQKYDGCNSKFNFLCSYE